MRRLTSLLTTLVIVLPLAALAQDSVDGADDGAAAAETAEEAPEEGGETVAAVERNNVRDPEEVEAFKAIQERFQERALEFEADVQRYLSSRRSEELAKVSDGYDALVQNLEEKERAQRDLAIDRLKEFLIRYPDVPEADNVRFRLAELYYEKAVEEWLDAQANFASAEAEYDRKLAEAEAALEAGDPTLYENLGELEFPQKDLARSIELYQQIIARNEPLDPEDRWTHLDRAYYSLGFSYMDNQAKQHDFVKARMAFQELLRVTGEEGDLSDAAHMFLGKLLFENEKKFPEALAEYAAVVEKGPKGPYYDDGMFQLAWTSYKLAGGDPERYEPRALELFTKILDDSERTLRESGKESDYAPDARLNLARTLADISDRSYSDPEGYRSPVQVTQEYFGRIGPRPWERDVYVALAEVLAGCIPVPDACAPGTQNGGRYEFDGAIEVYEVLQTDPRWVNEPDNPIFQRKKIWLLPQKQDRDLDRDLPIEQQLLVERYGETIIDPYTGTEKPNPWWVANRNNPDALDTVRQFVEGSLAQVAIGMMQEAQRDKDPAKYRMAAAKFREYMDKFPIADNFFENQWYLANALLNADPKDPTRPWGSYEEAVREFTSLVQSRDNHPYGDGALFGVMKARQSIIEAKGDIHGPLDQRSNSAEVEKTVTTDAGKDILVYRLPTDHQALIDSMDLLTEHEFSEPLQEGIPDYREAYDENKWFLRYTPALILAKHNRFDEARERAERLIAIGEDDIDARCNVDEISYAATLIADSYQQEGDLQNIASSAARFAKLFQQCDAAMLADKPDWEGIIEGAEFRICQAQKDAGDRLGAAQCYEDYFDKHQCADRAMRDNENCRFAAYNAPNSYEIVGRAEKANELFERYVDLYPRDELSLPLYYRIALNYEAVFELGKAIDYYQRLVDNDPRRQNENTADALYNVAFLKIGLGDHRGAAQGFEKYEQVFRDQEDAEKVLFKAGEQWEKVSARDALRFYNNYLRRYGPDSDRSNPSHVIEAKYRIAQLQKDNERAYERAMNELQDTFDQYSQGGTQLSSIANRYVAEWAFKKLQEDYDELVDKELTGDQEKDNAMLEKLDAEEIPAFEAKARDLLQKYKDFEYGTGAFYLMGSAKLFIAELIYSMDCPFRSDEDCDLWWELYEESWRPVAEEFEGVARSRFEALIEQGKTQKQHSRFIDRAYETLNKLDPFNYPDIKEEARGGTELKGLPTVRPLTIPDPNAQDKDSQDAPTEPDGGAQPTPEPTPEPGPQDGARDGGGETPDGGTDSPWGGQ